MRISITKGNPYYITNPEDYHIYLNNKQLLNCVLADEKAGIVVCNKEDDSGDVYTRIGKVEIVKVK